MNVDRRLTARYLLALTLVAATMVVTHLLETRRLGETAHDARTINVSGMQRMLSQRIALLARELSLTDGVVTAEVLAAKLELAVDTMRANHAGLAAGWRERAAGGDPAFIALTASDGLSVKVERYVATAARLLDLYRAGSASAVRGSDIPDRLAVIARNGFLAELDAVVERYERESVAKTAALKRLETLSMAAGLALLLLEALFIFRPMVRRIGSTVGALETSNARLEASNEELAQFNYRVSHDVVAPVASARGFLALALDDVRSGEHGELPELLGEVSEQLDRFDRLVVQLADVARAAARDSTRQAVALRPLIETLRADLPPAVRDAIVLSVDIDPSCAFLDSDPARLRQVLATLFDNAVAYRNPAENVARIIVRARRERGSPVLDVSDDGLGIDPAFGARAFEMFARDRSSPAGLGLGLYIAARHVSHLGGTLSIANHAKPTVLRIVLPPNGESRREQAGVRTARRGHRGGPSPGGAGAAQGLAGPGSAGGG